MNLLLPEVMANHERWDFYDFQGEEVEEGVDSEVPEDDEED